MMGVRGGVAPEDAASRPRPNAIQVSNVKKPLFFYVNLAKRLLAQHEELELSAVGLAMSTLVSVVEIIKRDGLAEPTGEFPIRASRRTSNDTRAASPPRHVHPLPRAARDRTNASDKPATPDVRTSTIAAKGDGDDRDGTGDGPTSGKFKAKLDVRVRRLATFFDFMAPPPQSAAGV